MTASNSTVTAAATLSAPALIVAYMAQPDVAAMEPGQRAFLLFVALCSYALLALIIAKVQNAYIRLMLCGLTGIATTCIMTPTIASYDAAEARKRQQCFEVQRTMLHNGRSRGDDAAVFQALGCRLQQEVLRPHLPPGR